MPSLHLGRDWELGEALDGGSGGFGSVFEVVGDRSPAVAKLIPKRPGAERELLVPDEVAGARNVVPVWDQGEYEDYWVLVMPRADVSLHQALLDAGGPLSVAEAVPVLIDVCDALVDLEGRLVHRDIKPKNVLLLNGHWCLADFGIARYSDATTETNTWKDIATWQYAAPERWRNERATTAADVYSVGVMAYEMLVGRLPFDGESDLRDAHLHRDPPRADAAGTAMSALIDECLFKAPEARPRPTNLRRRLESVLTAPTTPGLQALANANRAEVDRQSSIARDASVARSESERRQALANAGRRSLSPIVETILTAIELVAPASSVNRADDGPWSVALNQGKLTVGKPIAERAHEPRRPFEVVLATSIEVRGPQAHHVYAGRSHSLWFCDAQSEGEFAWFETAFMQSAFSSGGLELEPFALAPSGADNALTPVIGSIQVAWPFTVLEVGVLDEFVDRWAGWFAAASTGPLQHPTMIPERDPSGSWRR